MKRFMVEVNDNVDKMNLREVLYHNLPDGYEINEVKEDNSFRDGKQRMTTKQRDRLWELCGSYNVPFREDDYFASQFSPSSPIMYEGWIGGPRMNGLNNLGKTIYIGVEPDGGSHS